MKKTLLSLVCAGFLACQSVASEVSDKMTNNVYQFRRVLQLDKKKGSPIFYPDVYSTSFILKKGMSTYFVTNKHAAMAGFPDNFPYDKIHFTICEGEDDRDLTDDLVLKMIAVAPNSDIAIFEYGDVHPSSEYPRGNPPVGAECFTIGFPFGHIMAFAQGHVNSELDLNFQGNGDVYWTSLNVAPGMSGSPVYFIDPADEKLKLMGMILGYTQGFTQVIDIKQADDLLDRYLHDEVKGQQNLEAMLGKMYKKLGYR